MSQPARVSDQFRLLRAHADRRRRKQDNATEQSREAGADVDAQHGIGVAEKCRIDGIPIVGGQVFRASGRISFSSVFMCCQWNSA